MFLGTLIKVNGTALNCISGYEVEWYDLSKDAGRNAAGTMRLAYIATKYKVIVRTRPMHQTEFTSFYSSIPMQQLTVVFFNPYTNQNETHYCYRGDRKSSMIWDRQYIGKLYEPVEQSFIEL